MQIFLFMDFVIWDIFQFCLRVNNSACTLVLSKISQPKLLNNKRERIYKIFWYTSVVIMQHYGKEIFKSVNAVRECVREGEAAHELITGNSQ